MTRLLAQRALRPARLLPSPALARVLPAVLVPAIALLLARTERSFEERVWYLWALVILGALATLLVAAAHARVGRVQALGLAAAAGYAAWSYLSITWASFPAEALLEANRAATYAAVIAVMVLVVDSPTRRRLVVGAIAAASALLALGYGVRLLTEPAAATSLLFDGRLAMPIGYPNATAAFLLIGFWPLVSLAADARTAPWARVAAALGAGALPPAALLTQSRGAAVFFVLSGLLFVAVSPLRVRAVLPIAAAVGGTALRFDVLDRPFGAETGDLEAALRDAGASLLLIAAGSGLLTLLWAAWEERARTPAVVARALHLATLVALVGAALLGGAAAVRADAADAAGDYWSTFKAGDDATGDTPRLLSAAGSNRYDFWRVALVNLEERPLTGFGAGNFGWRYLLERRSGEMPTHAHGEIWDAASNLGLPGVALYVTLCLTALVAVPLTARGDWAFGAGLLAALAQWLAHAQGDWLLQNAAAGLLGSCLVGCALASAASRPPRSARRPLARPVAGVAIAAVALGGILPALLAARWLEAAYAASSAQAVELAERADRVAPLAAAPPLALASAHAEAGDEDAAAVALREAVRREPRNWPAWQRLAELERRRGDALAARRACAEARRSAPFADCA